MSMLDQLVERLLGRRVELLVQQALERQARDALYQYQVHGDRARLLIDPTAVVNNALFNLSSGEITVGRHAFFGHNVSVLPGTHDIEVYGRERQVAIPRSGRDVVIHEGAWLASEVLVLGPCEIGAHAVVGAGSLVLGDVPPYAIMVGSVTSNSTLERGPTVGLSCTAEATSWPLGAMPVTRQRALPLRLPSLVTRTRATTAERSALTRWSTSWPSNGPTPCRASQAPMPSS